MCTIKKHHSWILYPLLADYPKSVASLKEASALNAKKQPQPIFEEVGLEPQELRKGLCSLLSKEDHSAKIGHVFQLKKRDLFQLPQRASDPLKFYARTIKEPFEIYFKDLRIVLFESDVVFLMMRIDSKNMLPLEACMSLMYYLCEPKDQKNRFEIQKKSWNAETRTASYETVSVSLQEFVRQFIPYLVSKKDSEAHLSDALHRKPVIYSYLIADKTPEEHMLENLAHNYNASYKLTDIEINDSRNVLQIFSNSYWCASINGLCSLSVEVDAERTNAFFDNGFEHKWESEYFFLFINALHQKRSLINLLNEIRWYNQPIHDYSMIENRLIEFQKTNEHFSLFLLRCFFDVPSAVEHVNHVYELLQKAFNVADYQKEFDSKFKSLIAYYDTVTQRKNQIEEKQREIKKTYIEIYVAILGTFVSVLTVYSSSISIFEKWTGQTTDHFSLSSLILIVTLMIPVITVIANITNQLRDIKDNKQTIQKLKELL